MNITDPIANMLTCVRNGQMARKTKVDVPFSRLSEEILNILKREKFIKDVKFIESQNRQGTLRVYLKYTKDHMPAIQGIRRVSRPGLRVYVNNKNIPRVLGGLGIAIISTSRGIVTDVQAREMHTGGEVLCYVW